MNKKELTSKDLKNAVKEYRKNNSSSASIYLRNENNTDELFNKIMNHAYYQATIGDSEVSFFMKKSLTAKDITILIKKLVNRGLIVNLEHGKNSYMITLEW